MGGSGRVSAGTRLWMRRGVSVKSPILLTGFPGLGRVGRIALKYMAKTLDCRLAGFVTSPYFSAQAVVTKSGSARLMRGELYLKTLNAGGDLLLFTGDEHYEDIGGEYDTAVNILRFFKRCGGRMIITVGGHVSPAESASKVYCFSTERSLLEGLVKAGAFRAPEGTPVVGISGVLVSLAGLRGVPAACLLAETPGLYPDVRAARNVVKIVCSFLGLDLDLGGLDAEEKRVARLVKEFEKRYEALSQSTSLGSIVRELRRPDYVS